MMIRILSLQIQDWIIRTHIALYTLSPLPLSSSSTSSSPSASSRAPPRHRRRARRTRPKFALQRTRRANPPSSSSPPWPSNWRRSRQFIARNIILQHLGSLSFEGGRPRRIALVRLQSLKNFGRSSRELGKIWICGIGCLESGRLRGPWRGWNR